MKTKGFPSGRSGKDPPVNAGDARDKVDPWVGKSPRVEMATCSNNFAWKILWTEEPV